VNANNPESTPADIRPDPLDEPAEETRTWLPAGRWLRRYRPAWLGVDAIAGVTLAAYLLPAGIGDASLAGLPPEMGLYSCLFAGLVFWLFCSSRQTSITVTSAISLLIGSSVGEWAGGDGGRHAALASATALMVAAIAFIGWLTRAGAIVRFISEGVMIGFKCGVALFLASTQLPKLTGFSGAHGDFWENMGHYLSHLDQTNAAALIVGLIALALLLIGRVYLPNKPVALFVVVAGIVAASIVPLADYGVKLLGEVPQGLPQLGLPAIAWADLNLLLPLSLACFLLGAVETAAIGRMFRDPQGDRFDANQEFLAMAAANLGAGLGRGFPVSGGMSQSAVNRGAGARTPLSGLIAAGCLLLVALFLSNQLRALPQPVLAAVVLVAVVGLLNVSALVRFWRNDRTEFVVAIATLLGVLGSGLLRGVLIGAVISLLLLIHRISRPHIALLGRVPGTDRFSDAARHPENEFIPGVAIYRPESALVYFNIDHVCQSVLQRTMAAEPRPHTVVLDLSASPHVDFQSAHGLAELAESLHRQGVRIQIIEARAAVRDRLRAEGVDERLGGVYRDRTLSDVLKSSH
jgi:high affinity sulfate transporter 1